MQDPSDELVKLLVNRFFEKPLTASRLSTFKEYTRRAISNSINESISYRLKNALSMNDKIPSQQQEEMIAPIDENAEALKAITTEEEIEGSQIVKAILRETVPAARIAFRDTQSYFGILLDDNNRKPLARLHFNFSKKYLELFHNGKDNGQRKLLESLDDIYKYRKELLATVHNYQQNIIVTETTNTVS